MTTEDDKKNPHSKEAIDSLQMSDEDLLKKIFDSSNRGANVNASTSIARTLPYFSSLLIKLSRQADESTKKNIAVQKKLTNLTVAIVALTVILLFVTVGQLYISFQETKKPIIINLKYDQPHNQTNQKDNTKKIHNNDNAKTMFQSIPSVKKGEKKIHK